MFLDNNSKPVNATESVKILDNPEVRKELAEDDIMMGSVEILYLDPRPTQPGKDGFLASTKFVV